LFTFNASSFTIDAAVESLLRSRGAVTLDFGQSACINSDLVPLIMAELLEKSSSATSEELIAQMRADIARSEAQCQKMAEDGARLVQQLQSTGAEVASLKEQLAGANRTIESLKSESARLQVAQKSAPAPAIDRGQYYKVVRELQQLKAQNAEAITSLKVLEDENEELREELDSLKGQAKAAPAPKAG
jgi:predicted  nucleic acid-binding Zn-ribbon protein